MNIVNEMSVIVEFAQKASTCGFEIVAIGNDYPDATIKRGGISYQVEFEYKAKNFIFHRHDPRLCDLIICWENDLGDDHLPILALSEEGWHIKEIALLGVERKEVLYWKGRALAAEAEIKRLKVDTSGDVVEPKRHRVRLEEIQTLLEQGFTQTEAAKRLKVSVSTLKRTLNGKMVEVSQ